MAHILSIVNTKQLKVLEHGKVSKWSYTVCSSNIIYTTRGKEVREYRVVEDIGRGQYRATLEDCYTIAEKVKV